jgi:peptide/nickel transport system ATP-binding protein
VSEVVVAVAPKSRRTTTGTVISVKDLHVEFPSEDGVVKAVRGINFDLQAGEVLGIVGESGSGKSVTSLAVMGLLPDNARVRGSITLHGDELVGKSDAAMTKIRGKEMAMVFQDPLSALTPIYTVGYQLVEALQVHQDLSGSAATRRSVELLDLVGIPNAKLRVKSFPHEFSGGMRQRVMIAMAIANDPDVIIADEPTTALDVTIQAQVLDVLKVAQSETGAAVIMITHDLGVVAGIADRVQVMYAGRAVETGTVDDVYYRPRMPYTIGLLASVPRLDEAEKRALVPIEGNPPSPLHLPAGCKFTPRCPMAIDGCSLDEPALVDVDPQAPQVAHRAACIRSGEIAEGGLGYNDIYPVPEIPVSPVQKMPRAERAEVLAIDGLVKHFPLMKGAVFKKRIGTVHAVDGVDLDIRRGETLGLVGESGCGKTTTLLQILDLVKPQQGRIVVLGKDTAELQSRAQRKAIRRDLQVVFQDPMASLDPRLPVFDILAEPLRAHRVGSAEVAKRVAELLTLVGLESSHANRYPQHFSGGQRQRIGIARALALEPRLIVLDEPVAALDVSIQAGVINLLDELRAELDLSYLFVAHDLAVVRHIADRVAVMYLGRIVEIGDVNSVFDTPTHPYTQALLSAVPIPDPEKERTRVRILLKGDLPSPLERPSGCRFRTRCPKFLELTEAEKQRCIDEDPQLRGSGGDHEAACHYQEVVSVF